MIHGKPGASWPMDPTQECNVSLTLEKPWRQLMILPQQRKKTTPSFHDKIQQDFTKRKAPGGASKLRGSPPDHRINSLPWPLRPPHPQVGRLLPTLQIYSLHLPASIPAAADTRRALPPHPRSLPRGFPSGCLEAFVHLWLSGVWIHICFPHAF